MSQKIYTKELDYRTVNCRHARLREALQFRPNAQNTTPQEDVMELAEAYTIYEAPVKKERELSRGLEIFRAVASFAFACLSLLLQPL